MTNLQTLFNLLTSKGWTWLGDSEFCDYAEEDFESYGDWEIALCAPNGGILSVDIIHRDTQGWWSIPTHERFGYYDEEAITAFAKGVIDEVEKELVQASGQLSLFDLEKVK